jgi:hypothetical protein
MSMLPNQRERVGRLKTGPWEGRNESENPTAVAVLLQERCKSSRMLVKVLSVRSENKGLAIRSENKCPKDVHHSPQR